MADNKTKNGQGQGRSQLFERIAEQNATIERQGAQIDSQGATINNQARYMRGQDRKIATLANGLQSLASALGPQALQHVTAAMSRSADVHNPAQPIPEPPAQPAPFSTQDAKEPEAMASPQSPGLAPGTTNDVAADATTTAYTPGEDPPSNALHNLVDVTTPVDGTQGPAPIDQVRTLTDVRAGNPMVPDVAFPLNGPFAGRQRLQGRSGSRQQQGGGQPQGGSSRRTYACLRLVEARAATGVQEAEDGNKYTLADAISRDASRSTEDIEAEAATLEGASHRMASRSPNPQSARGLVPRQASAAPRSAPSMRSEASYGTVASMPNDDDASDLFWNS